MEGRTCQYKSKNLLIKVIEITQPDALLVEFIYWKQYENNDSFLKFKGAYIHGSEAYLVFEFFAFTLEELLKKGIINQEKKSLFAKESLKILETLQRQKKMIKDLRPGVLGVTDNKKLKLIDFGIDLLI
jgi:serine/threonine protein kinase